MKISDVTHYKKVPFPKGTFVGSPCCDWTYSMREGGQLVYDPFGNKPIYECDECKKLYSYKEIELNMNKVKEDYMRED